MDLRCKTSRAPSESELPKSIQGDNFATVFHFILEPFMRNLVIEDLVESNPRVTWLVRARRDLVAEIVMQMAIRLRGRHVIQFDGLCLLCPRLLSIPFF